MELFNTIVSIMDTVLVTSTYITGRFSIATFVSGAELPVGFALRKTGRFFSLATAITQKSFKIFTIKQEKHNVNQLLAQN